LTLENLGNDLYDIVKNPSTSGLYRTVTMQEISFMKEHTSSDIPLEVLHTELDVLISEIRSKLTATHIQSTRLVGLQLQDRDTLALIYNQIKA
jgi:hypothetical protein